MWYINLKDFWALIDILYKFETVLIAILAILDFQLLKIDTPHGKLPSYFNLWLFWSLKWPSWQEMAIIATRDNFALIFLYCRSIRWKLDSDHHKTLGPCDKLQGSTLNLDNWIQTVEVCIFVNMSCYIFFIEVKI